MIKTTCFGQHWPSSGSSSERFVWCKGVYIGHADACLCLTQNTRWWDVNLHTQLHALCNHSYSMQIFRMKNLMMVNVDRKMYFLSFFNKHQLDIHCCVAYLLTYCMVQSPSWEANWFAACQEIPRISRNPKVHNRTHKRPPPVSILGRPNPVHIPTSHSCRSVLILSTHLRLGLPNWTLSLRFPHQDPIHPPVLTRTRHMPSPSQSSQFYHPHNIGWGGKMI